jgi:hypothetical protein
VRVSWGLLKARIHGGSRELIGNSVGIKVEYVGSSESKSRKFHENESALWSELA